MILTLSACTNSSTADIADSATDTAAPPVNPMNETAEAPKATPLPYPVYTTFDQLAPLFEQNNDTTYVINFWATWCKPCVEELPYFEKLAEDNSGKPVKIVMVSLDFAKEVRGKLLDFVQNRPFELPVIALVDHRYNDWIDRVDPEWSGAIPITVVYRGDQRIFMSEQFDSYEQLAEMVNQVSA